MEQKPIQLKFQLGNLLLYIFAIVLVIFILIFLFFSKPSGQTQQIDDLKQATASSESKIEQ